MFRDSVINQRTSSSWSVLNNLPNIISDNFFNNKPGNSNEIAEVQSASLSQCRRQQYEQVEKVNNSTRRPQLKVTVTFLCLLQKFLLDSELDLQLEVT